MATGAAWAGTPKSWEWHWETPALHSHPLCTLGQLPAQLLLGHRDENVTPVCPPNAKGSFKSTHKSIQLGMIEHQPKRSTTHPDLNLQI